MRSTQIMRASILAALLVSSFSFSHLRNIIKRTRILPLKGSLVTAWHSKRDRRVTLINQSHAKQFMRKSRSQRTFELNSLAPATSQLDEEQKLAKVRDAFHKSKEEAVPTTLSDAIRVFFFSYHGVGPTSVVLILACLAYWRLQMAPLSMMDGLAFVGSILFWFWQEHFLHSKVLHSKSEWYGKTIHQGHHDKPYFHISIDPAPLMLAWLGSAHFAFRILFPLPFACSATLGYLLSGLGYEWAHYIVHTKVRPQSKFMKTVRDNHIRHHCVDDRYWFAFSCPQMDNLFGTNPDVQVVRVQNRQCKHSAPS